MAKFILSPEALEDLDLIWLFIAQDNPQAADRVQEAAYRVSQILADHPELGRVRHLPASGLQQLRSFVIPDFPNYVIFYRPTSGGVEIIRVIHGSRDVDNFLGS